MVTEHETTLDVERVRRMVDRLDDGLSQDLLKRYWREIEYEVKYCAEDRDRRISI